MAGRVISFHSHAGGAGTTMAVANVAWRLAHAGLKVCVVDWHFASPGVHAFLKIQGGAEAASTKGLLDYFEAWKRDLDLRTAEAPSFDPCLAKVVGAEALKGALHVVPLARMDHMWPMRAEFVEWDDFYRVDHGGSCVEELRAQLVKTHDVVLVDTESGNTWSCGPSVIQLPDAVVFMTPPTQRGLEGALNAARAVAGAPAEERVDRPFKAAWLALARLPLVSSAGGWYAKNVEEIAADPAWGGRKPFVLPEISRWAFGEHVLPPGQPDFLGPDQLGRAYDDMAATFTEWLRTEAS